MATTHKTTVVQTVIHRLDDLPSARWETGASQFSYEICAKSLAHRGQHDDIRLIGRSHRLGVDVRYVVTDDGTMHRINNWHLRLARFLLEQHIPGSGQPVPLVPHDVAVAAQELISVEAGGGRPFGDNSVLRAILSVAIPLRHLGVQPGDWLTITLAACYYHLRSFEAPRAEDPWDEYGPWKLDGRDIESVMIA